MINMKKMCIVFLTFGASCLFTNANAVGIGEFNREVAKERFDEIDVDQSGTIDLSELYASVDRRFAETDTNGDGELSKEEIKNHRKKMKFDRLDKDHNGYISEEELNIENVFVRMRFMSKADKNGDDLISKDEFFML